MEAEENKDEGKNKFKMSNLFLLKERDSAVPLEQLHNIRDYTRDEVIKPNKTIFMDREFKTMVSK